MRFAISARQMSSGYRHWGRLRAKPQPQQQHEGARWKPSIAAQFATCCGWSFRHSRAPNTLSLFRATAPTQRDRNDMARSR